MIFMNLKILEGVCYLISSILQWVIASTFVVLKGKMDVFGNVFQTLHLAGKGFFYLFRKPKEDNRPACFLMQNFRYMCKLTQVHRHTISLLSGPNFILISTTSSP